MKQPTSLAAFAVLSTIISLAFSSPHSLVDFDSNKNFTITPRQPPDDTYNPPPGAPPNWLPQNNGNNPPPSVPQQNNGNNSPPSGQNSRWILKNPWGGNNNGNNPPPSGQNSGRTLRNPFWKNNKGNNPPPSGPQQNNPTQNAPPTTNYNADPNNNPNSGSDPGTTGPSKGNRVKALFSKGPKNNGNLTNDQGPQGPQGPGMTGPTVITGNEHDGTNYVNDGNPTDDQGSGTTVPTGNGHDGTNYVNNGNPNPKKPTLRDRVRPFFSKGPKNNGNPTNDQGPQTSGNPGYKLLKDDPNAQITIKYKEPNLITIQVSHFEMSGSDLKLIAWRPITLALVGLEEKLVLLRYKPFQMSDETKWDPKSPFPLPNGGLILFVNLEVGRAYLPSPFKGAYTGKWESIGRSGGGIQFKFYIPEITTITKSYHYKEIDKRMGDKDVLPLAKGDPLLTGGFNK